MKYNELLKLHPELFTNNNALFEIIIDDKIINTWATNRKKELAKQGLPKNWGDIGVVYEDPYIIIVRDLVKFPSGNLGSYFRLINSADIKGGQSSVILPIVNDMILLMNQFRHPTRKWHWEVPRGYGEPNTSAVDNAKKELLEEIEGEVAELVSLGQYHSNTGLEGVITQLFLARMEVVGNTHLDEGIVSYKFFTVKQVEKMICNEEITDGFTIAAFTRAKLKGLI